MNTRLLRKRFGLIGARLRVSRLDDSGGRAGIDIRADAEGEFFDLRVAPQEGVVYDVVDARPDMRHLLLLARRDGAKEKFLCGHDERHWFVSAVPGAGVSNVVGAMEALQPFEVRHTARERVRRIKHRLRRRNKAFVRQGEWFFVPVREPVRPILILRNVPLRRDDRGKPHFCEEMGFEPAATIYTCTQYRNGITESDYKRLVFLSPWVKLWNWRTRKSPMRAFVRGRVSHPDHKTVFLGEWHRALPNTEHAAPETALDRVVFYD